MRQRPGVLRRRWRFHHRRAHQRAGRTNHHKLMFGIDATPGGHLAVALGGLQGDSWPPRPCCGKSSASGGVFHNHSPRPSTRARRPPRSGRSIPATPSLMPRTRGLAPHRPHFLFIEADRLAAAEGKDDFAAPSVSATPEAIVGVEAEAMMPAPAARLTAVFLTCPGSWP